MQVLLLVLCFSAVLFSCTVPADDIPKEVREAASGIVRIYSVCRTDSQVLETRERTGFLVGQKGGEPLVITAYDQLVLGEKEKKTLSEKYKLDENERIETQLYMVFQGDIRFDLSDGDIWLSADKNLAILRLRTTLTDEYNLEFASGTVHKDMTVYLLSFPSYMARGDNFSGSTVNIARARVTNLGTDEKTKNSRYFFHNVSGDDVLLGSPFVDETGRIVGMMIGDFQDKKGDNRLAVGNEEIIRLLDVHNGGYVIDNKEPLQDEKNSLLSIILGMGVLVLAVVTIVRIAARWRLQKKFSIKRFLNENGRLASLDKWPVTVFLLRTSTWEKIPLPVSIMETDRGIIVGRRPNSSSDKRSNAGYEQRISGSEFIIMLSGNPAISRRHVRFTYVSGEYYIEDLGSKYGTILRNRKLVSGERARLEDGIEFYLAKERFAFRVER